MSLYLKPDDILAFLVSDGLIPSSFGSQLERLRDGVSNTADPIRAREEAERQMLENAEILRTVREFSEVFEFSKPTPRSQGLKSLEKIQKGTIPRKRQGEIALNSLRVFQAWGPRSQERGFVAVYGYLRSIAPTKTPPLDLDLHGAVQAFRDGTAKRARDIAASTYADSLIALSRFLDVRNKRS